MGIGFKAGTDDLRYSPIVEIAEQLIGRGKEIKIVDNHVQISKIMGQNKSYVMEKLPHIGNLLTDDINKSIMWSDIIIFTNKEKPFLDLSIPDDKIVIDLSRIEQYRNHNNYNGLNW